MYLVYSGNRILTLGEVPKDQVYALKLKGISICFSMLKAALSGSYVNFGVFRLYGATAESSAEVPYKHRYHNSALPCMNPRDRKHVHTKTCT